MKCPPIDQLVYECMFPKPKSTDPQNFQALLQRQLVPEVRLETQSFYGHLSSQEAKYPGLDYSYRPHRVRLSRYTWHRRLFRAFDNLGLTDSEIAGLTKWEGTRWAKERFEKEQGIVIRDTTADDISDWVEPELRNAAVRSTASADVEDLEGMQGASEADDDLQGVDDGEESDAELNSVGIELNERLRAAVAQREAGNVGTVMDEEWEQWLKEAAEAGGLPLIAPDLRLSPNANLPGTRPATETFPLHPRVLNAARLGQWQQIPDFLHDMVRQNIEASERRSQSRAAGRPVISPSTLDSILSRPPRGPEVANEQRLFGAIPYPRTPVSDRRPGVPVIHNNTMSSASTAPSNASLAHGTRPFLRPSTGSVGYIRRAARPPSPWQHSSSNDS
ncbi:hypothetical protein F5884DRAFT_670332 [Xylogone sp. PMI_703]|nr:hypothetical protein F5884DRAFT_670332 [Xylogone sp. PMI_703]